ncbi:hypothetical protein Bca52824_089057 [Brassica carinata]|uniref:Uncharacterized protein n=1 Tax=Brassica carinata TaxID=52824 RepID=A0A8X7PH07_BRACI|nr:hypothetical protein Bca52824_089057 [Brassica carinata]
MDGFVPELRQGGWKRRRNRGRDRQLYWWLEGSGDGTRAHAPPVTKPTRLQIPFLFHQYEGPLKTEKKLNATSRNVIKKWEWTMRSEPTSVTYCVPCPSGSVLTIPFN